MEFTAVHPNPWMMVPFGLLLAAIALGPLYFSRWWLRHDFKVAFGLGAVVLAYYALGLQAYGRVLDTAHEYVSFIALIGALFVVSGGIHIRVKSQAAPAGNVLFLLIGALAANLLGTTGASMILIRPWIRMNQPRFAAHHIVFFIFLVANVGGCLTPIGDPPLFLGYLQGVPFWWVAAHCYPMWLAGVGLLLGTFYWIDRRHLSRAMGEARDGDAAEERWGVEGLPNLIFLGVILCAVFVSRPVYLREGLMLAAAAGSYFTTPRRVHDANRFTFHPIREVAVLFVGIFATMMPALDWLSGGSAALLGSQPSAGVFYWGCGGVSSVLDNAPTYLGFLSALFGSVVDHDVVAQVRHLVEGGGAGLASLAGPHADQIRNTFLALQQYHAREVLARAVTPEQIQVCFLLGNSAFNRCLVAISVAAVFFGATTYIGNGPNFMVKSIVDHEGIRTPTFAGYFFRYAMPFLGPLLLAVGWLFFR